MLGLLLLPLLAFLAVSATPTPAKQAAITLPRLPDHHSYPLPGDPLPINVTILLPQEVRAWTAPAYYAS
jgi:hypothetical protein